MIGDRHERHSIGIRFDDRPSDNTPPIAAGYGSQANGGSIIATYVGEFGILLQGGGTVTNTGVISGDQASGIEAVGGYATIANNAGVISGAGADSAAILLAAGGNVTNSGAVNGGDRGIYIYGGKGTVTNANSIDAGDTGIKLGAGGKVVNQAIGQISADGTAVYITGGVGTVVNAGSLRGKGGDQFESGGIWLSTAGSKATNTGSIYSLASYGIGLGNGGTITNSGSISGLVGVDLGSFSGSATPGTLVNQSGGSVIGYDGVVSAGNKATVTNAGAIQGTTIFPVDGQFTGNAIVFDDGGTLTNQANTGDDAGLVSGLLNGVVVNQASTTITNYGLINGTVGCGILLGLGGKLSNETSKVGGTTYTGTINGGVAGVYSFGGPLTIVNTGLIESTFVPDFSFSLKLPKLKNLSIDVNAWPGLGISLVAGGNVTNKGTISGGLVGIYADANPVITNSGSIEANTTISATAFGLLSISLGLVASGVFLLEGGTVNNEGTGKITGDANGVSALGKAATVSNSGYIAAEGLFGQAVALDAGGTVTNSGGVISGGANGVFIHGGLCKVVNSGTIQSLFGDAINLQTGGIVTNQHQGDIEGHTNGIEILGGAGFVTNAAKIGGPHSSIAFEGSGANILTLQTGSVLNGTAFGSQAKGATTALVLSGHGTLTNAFDNFSSLQAQSGSDWTLAGSTIQLATVLTLVSGTLDVTGGSVELGAGAGTSDGAVTIANGGTLVGSGTLVGEINEAAGGLVEAQSGTLTIAGSISGGGKLEIDDNAKLRLGFDDTNAIQFLGGGGTLELAQPSQVTGVISKLQVGDIIDLDLVSATGAVLNGKHLVVSEKGGGSLVLNVAGGAAGVTFQVQSDGHGGSDIEVQVVAAHVAFEPALTSVQTISDFDARSDTLFAPVEVLAVDSLHHGALSEATFGTDLSRVLDASHLQADHAVLFVPNSGDLEGGMFLVVDANGIAGYQTGNPVFHLIDGMHLKDLSQANLVQFVI